MRPSVGWSTTFSLVAVVGALALALTTPVQAKTETTTPVAIDAAIPDFKIADRNGGVFDFAQRAITAEGVKAHLLASAKKAGAADPKDLGIKFDAIKGALNDEGKPDEGSKFEFIQGVVKHFGFQVTEEATAEMKSLADLAAWIVKRKDKPLLFVVWSPKCPTSSVLNDRTIEFVQATGVRMYAIASNYKDTNERYQEFIEAQDFNVRIFPDRDQRVCDILGGKQTPHYFLVDTKGVLRYKGALSNDVRDTLDEDKKKTYLLDAFTAIEAGKDVPVKMTKPFG